MKYQYTVTLILHFMIVGKCHSTLLFHVNGLQTFRLRVFSRSFTIWNVQVHTHLLIYSLTLSLSPLSRSLSLSHNLKSDFLFFRAWIQGALAIEVLLGLTWVFGYFFINKETVAVAYIFTILNSLQGLFIFIFHCAMNRKVKKPNKDLLFHPNQRMCSNILSQIYSYFVKLQVRGEYKKLVRLSKRAPSTTTKPQSNTARKQSGSYELYVPSS